MSLELIYSYEFNCYPNTFTLLLLWLFSKFLAKVPNVEW